MEFQMDAAFRRSFSRRHASAIPPRQQHCKRGWNSFLNFSRRISSTSTLLHNSLRSSSSLISKRKAANILVNVTASGRGLETLEFIQSGKLGEHPDEASLREVVDLEVSCLAAAAARIRDRREDGNIVTFSPKVFIPLTRVCRDFCGYCTFAASPRPGQAVYMSVDEVLEVARAGVAAGCTEALFTLGDKPELLYSQAKHELEALGHTSTVSYAAEVARIVLQETGLLPHMNVGVMSREDVILLRRVSVSQGLMLESISEKLLEPGGPHYRCPDKHPSARLSSIAAAGEEKVPFTSGLLIGIGETREERLQALLALRNLHKQYGHIQELIIQNFRAKKGTAMAKAAEPPLVELEWTIAMARLVFGTSMSIQAPPNLTPTMTDGKEWKRLIDAGINDWGGISPVTKDWVNPEDPTVLRRVLAHENSLGYARAEEWSPGLAQDAHSSFLEDKLSNLNGGSTGNHFDSVTNPAKISVGTDGTMHPTRAIGFQGMDVKRILKKIEEAVEPSEVEVTRLFRAMGPEFHDVVKAADELRARVNGEKVSYVVNRNINYTNVCGYKCQFCAFSKGKLSENLRGKPYSLSLDEVSRRAVEAWERGATEVCMQGGIHPEFTGETYMEILKAVKTAAPELHVHAFSPLEVFQGAFTLGVSVEEFLVELKNAGLGSLPGTAAEVLDDEVRRLLCPDKISTDQWLEVMETAHRIGLRTTSTIMFGHLDRSQHWARHLLRLRNLARNTGGFSEFVPLPFVHMQAPIYLKGRARKGPTSRECVLMHSIARLVLHPFITNVQASWVKMGPGGAQALLAAGCNDMGGSLMNESITRAAGASHGEELSPKEMETLILSTGKVPYQRTTLYGDAPAQQRIRAFSARPLT
uniref:FO synthase n=1 Tax=Physcomitrium patens TaxID=3218 RepID=A0A7I4DNG6_PHYPA